MPKWLQWVIGGVLIIGAVALSIASAGLGTIISGMIGNGIWAAVAGGFIAGGIVGAASGALISTGTQIISNGFEEFSWGQVGQGALIGLVTGAIAGGLFGGITYTYSSKALATATSGLDAAKYELSNSFEILNNVEQLAKFPFANSNIAKVFANTMINYNKAYTNYIIAESTYSILKFVYSTIYFIAENRLSDWLGKYM